MGHFVVLRLTDGLAKESPAVFSAGQEGSLRDTRDNLPQRVRGRIEKAPGAQAGMSCVRAFGGRRPGPPGTLTHDAWASNIRHPLIALRPKADAQASVAACPLLTQLGLLPICAGGKTHSLTREGS